jgi:hypothetical protein
MTETVLEIALGYIGLGWSPVPVPFRKKKPIVEGWDALRINKETAPEYFNGAPQNIGVILGPASGGLTDVDLDSPEAVECAPYFLPKTTCMFGRKSKRFSHYLYVTNIASSISQARIDYKDADGKKTLVELRIGGEAGSGNAAQTIFPGSTHEEGEPIAWDEPGEPTRVADDVLIDRVNKLAAAVLFARHWPDQGGRHDAALALGGFLHRAGLNEADAKVFIQAVARAAGDAEWKDRVKCAEIDSNKISGYPAIEKIYGRDVAARAAKWLNYMFSGNGSAQRADNTDSATIGLDDFYAYMPSHSYLFVPSREMWAAGSVNARVCPVELLDSAGNQILDRDRKPKTMPATMWLDRNRAVEQMTWCPGEPMLVRDRLIAAEGGWIERAGVTCFNLYRPPTIKLGSASEANPWLELVHKVFPTDAEHIIKCFAHRVQRPQDKINHALVLGGNMGIGKDTMLEPVKRAVGPWNFCEVSPTNLLGRFNGFLKSVVLRVSEARDLGDVNRYQFHDHMKSYTAAPPDVLRIDEKFTREH